MEDLAWFSHLGLGEMFEDRGALYAKTDKWVKVPCRDDGSYLRPKERVWQDFQVVRVGRYLRDTTSG